MIGSAENLKVKTFYDYKDGDVQLKINKFFEDNPYIEVVDIKYFNGYSVANTEDISYGRETGMVVYRETPESVHMKEMVGKYVKMFEEMVDKNNK